MTTEQVVAKLDAAGIANARVNAPEEVWQHPQLKDRMRWRDVGSPVGEVPALLPPATISGLDPRMDPIPAIGEHTNGILREIGFSREEIAALHRDAAISCDGKDGDE